VADAPIESIPLSAANVAKRYVIVLGMGVVTVALVLSPPPVRPLGTLAFWYTLIGHVSGVAMAAILVLGGGIPIARSVICPDAIRFEDEAIVVWRPARTIRKRRDELGREVAIEQHRGGPHLVIRSRSGWTMFDVMPVAFTTFQPKLVRERVQIWLESKQ